MNPETFVKALFYLGALAICSLVALFLRTGADPGLGCKAVSQISGWPVCQVVEHHVWFVDFRGCSDSDGHSYDVTGINAAGQPSQALVCCGTLLKSCTVRTK